MKKINLLYLPFIVIALITIISCKSTTNESSAGSKGNSSIQSFTVKGLSFAMVSVEGGSFMMGGTAEQGDDASDDEKPIHKVTISDFLISQTEVTQELYEAVMDTNPSIIKGSKRPVENISRADCGDFIEKLNKLTGKKYRVPSEAEWEYAARGGNKSKGYKYSGSNTLDDVAWYNKNSDNGLDEKDPNYGTHDVATKAANELGIYDMSGNVDEFCEDCYADYSSEEQTDPVVMDAELTTSTEFVSRGGCWTSEPDFCRVSCRSYDLVYGHGSTGIRLAHDK